ncbi:MAG: Fic family protein [Bacilli bacterium]|nr:Fic family protein [Bacilli bacterium]
MYSYKKLDKKLKELNIKKSNLTDKIGISSRTLAKMAKGEKIRDNVLLKIASYLNCQIDDLYQYEYDNHILQILKEEKDAKLSGGLYHELQIRMTYNSNHIEESKLTEDQTRLIFETRTIVAKDGIPVDDIIETSNHFRAIDYCIDIAMEPLSEEIIKHFHLLLKQSTKDASLSYFQVGDYKLRSNMVGGKETCKPEDVSQAMRSLVSRYENKSNIQFEDIIEFHVDFERIHPFQDGNGRVGRLIALKECLRWNIIPFIIEDSKKAFYYRGLSSWTSERGWLIDTCLDGQDTFKILLKELDIL